MSSTLAGKGDVGTVEEALANREEIAATPEGAQMIMAVDDWQEGFTSPDVFRGEARDWTESGTGGTHGAVLAEAIGSSEPMDVSIYRGISTDTPLSSIESEYQVGSSFDTMPSSYSVNQAKAESFTRRSGTPVVFEVEPGSRALNIQPISSKQVFLPEQERVSMGRFTVTGTERWTGANGNEGVRIKVRQDSVFSDS